MKTIFHHLFIICLLSCVLLASCEREHAAIANLRVETVHGGTDTKITGQASSYEDDVLSVQLFVFDRQGALEASDYFPSSTGSLQVTNGSKTIYALVNNEKIGDPSSENSLLKTVSALQDNALDRLVMVGSVKKDITGDTDVIVRVNRLVSKIELGEIAADFAYGQSRSIKINSLYLTNVNSSSTLDGSGTADPSEWYNKMGYARSVCDGILYESIGVTLADKASHRVAHSFYAYPNHTETDTHGGSTFSSRLTRLVIDTDLGYYHIDFPDLSPNKAYIINKVTIKGPGGDTPEEHVERTNCTFIITVKDWETGASVTEII